MDSTTFNGIFFLTLTASILGFCGLIVNACIKSKCDNVEFCCIKVHRNVEAEEKIEEFEIAHRNPPNNPQSPESNV